MIEASTSPAADAIARFLALASPFVESGALTEAEVEALARVGPRFGEHDPEVLLGLAFVAAAPRLGHVVLGLDEAPDLWASEHEARLPWPKDLGAWHARALASPLVGDGRPFVAVPFALTPESARTPRLATQRRNAEEAHVAALVRARAATSLPLPASFDGLIARFFPDEPDGDAARAVRVAAAHSLAIVTGGPGTGKTFSITRLLAVLAEASARGEFVVRLAAPTGKAAARMGEAIAEGLATLDLAEAVRARIANLRAETLHRLVGLRRNGRATHDEVRPLRADLVVVDEASMIDLTLMRALLRAVPLGARLVLLGDPDQLASVEAGAVLGDLVRSDALAGLRVHFTKSRRFASAPSLAACAHALQSQARTAGEGAPPPLPAQLALFGTGEDDVSTGRAVDLLVGRAKVDGDPDPRRLEWLREAKGPGGALDGRQLARVVAPYRARYGAALAALPASPCDDELAALLDALDDYRILAVQRRGPLGVDTLAGAVEAQILGSAPARAPEAAQLLRHGLPVLVTENAPESGLTNGDVGVVVRVEGALCAVFRDARGVRRLAPARLPRVESAFVMTVHKSQGSQFPRVALILPGRPSPIATRELVYTALTRARETVLWVGTELELRRALAARTRRLGTLHARLAGANTDELTF